MSVTLDDVLQHLVARSGAPSTMGAQLERLRLGYSTRPDPHKAQADAEARMMEQAQLLRAIYEFAHRPSFHPTQKTLEKIQKQTRPSRPQGHIALEILRNYQEWATSSQERGLLQVYRYLTGIAPAITPSPPSSDHDLLQMFREGKAKRAHQAAADAYADAFLALSGYLETWNKKEKGA